MTPSITAEQRARIAREVTGHEWIVNAEENCIECFTGHQGLSYACWHPDFHPDDVNSRSQALDIIGWLADRIDTLGVYGQVFDQSLRDAKWREVKTAVRNKDIPALLQLVLELLENGNG